MAKAETKQEQAPAAAVGEATREAAVKVRILKTGTEALCRRRIGDGNGQTGRGPYSRQGRQARVLTPDVPVRLKTKY